jgi:hypothetical protein
MRSLLGMLRRRAVAQTVWCSCGASRHRLIVRYGDSATERRYFLPATEAHEIKDKIEMHWDSPGPGHDHGVVRFRDVFHVDQVIRTHEVTSVLLLPESKDPEIDG